MARKQFNIAECTDGQMVDIETLGIVPNSVILQIGACRFNVLTRETYDHFLVNIEPKTCIEAGMVFSKDTVKWWTTQSPEVIASLNENKVSIQEALTEFKAWIKRGSCISAQGVTFDMGILASAYDTVLHEDTPWNFWDIFDLRTVCAISGIKPVKGEMSHNAMADVESQCQVLFECFSPTEEEV
jgi:DNA polymerase III alpha subunit (gram-positive type)